jgi:hypothetical protein
MPFKLPFSSKPSTPSVPGVRIKKLTTYLDTVLPQGYTDLPYNGKSVTVPDYSPYLNAVGQYEAVLTQAAYFSRLAYEMNPVIASAMQLVTHNPVVFNTGLAMIRRKFSRYNQPTDMTVKRETELGKGCVLYKKHGIVETPCHIQVVDYRGKVSGCPHPGKKVLYISFRGTISLKSALTDAKAVFQNLGSLVQNCEMQGVRGNMAFAEYIQGAEQYRSTVPPLNKVNPFGAHFGFIENLIPVMPDICKLLELEYLADNTVDKIVVTGHSLGGANATLAALVLAGFKRAGISCLQRPSLHCITFGAPKLLHDYSRNVFNSLLDEGILTLDRVANRMKNLVLAATSMGAAINLVPTIPPNMVHPGYMVLKTEIKTQSRTGRSKNISDLRKMFAGISEGGLLGLQFNGLPTYTEFLNCFTRVMTDGDYKSLIGKLPFGTLYYGSKEGSYSKIKTIVATILQVSPESPELSATEVEAKEDASASSEAAGVSGNTGEEAAVEEGEEGQQAGGGVLTDMYKQTTVERGPNHIVYSCAKNISGLSCHMGYMGISYNGGVKNVSLSRPPFATFLPEGNTLRVKQTEPFDGHSWWHSLSGTVAPPSTGSTNTVPNIVGNPNVHVPNNGASNIVGNPTVHIGNHNVGPPNFVQPVTGGKRKTRRDRGKSGLRKKLRKTRTKTWRRR